MELDFQAIIKEYILPHWPFVFVGFILGLVGGPMKKWVWSKDRARRSRIAWWFRAFLPFHPAIAGALVGLLGWYIWKDGMVASPGIAGPGALVLYYAGAGALSSWVFAGIKYALISSELEGPLS